MGRIATLIRKITSVYFKISVFIKNTNVQVWWQLMNLAISKFIYYVDECETRSGKNCM